MKRRGAGIHRYRVCGVELGCELLLKCLRPRASGVCPVLGLQDLLEVEKFVTEEFTGIFNCFHDGRVLILKQYLFADFSKMFPGDVD